MNTSGHRLEIPQYNGNSIHTIDIQIALLAWSIFFMMQCTAFG